MKTTIILKEIADVSSDVAHAADAFAPAIPKSSSQPRLESAGVVQDQTDRPANEGFRELLHRRHTTQLSLVLPYHHGGLNE